MDIKMSEKYELIGFFRHFLAEKEGFEPSRSLRPLHDFQSCALDQLGDFSGLIQLDALRMMAMMA